MKKTLFILMICILCVNIQANERKFGYIYQSSVLGKGNRELEIWTTARIGKDIPYFAATDHKVEFEWGLSNRLQTAFYVNFRNTSIDDGNGMKTSFDFKGISTEWKYQLSSPSKAIGIALYGELGLNTDEAEFEGKLIFDKKIKKSTFAMNMVFEHEWEFSSQKPETEIALEGNLGWSYDITNSFALGIEARNHNVIKEGVLEHSALFAGPVASFSQPNWWLTLTVMPQITSLKEKSENTKLDLGEYENIQARLLFSFRL